MTLAIMASAMGGIVLGIIVGVVIGMAISYNAHRWVLVTYTYSLENPQKMETHYQCSDCGMWKDYDRQFHY